jgi:tetratricopeptide (TPR) repeat protein
LVAQFRADPQKAEEYYRRALASWESVIPGSIEAVKALNLLGSLALDAGDPTKAEDYYGRARNIVDKLSPSSEDAAINLNGLAVVAERRNEWTKALEYYGRVLVIRTKLSAGSLEVGEVFFNSGGPAFRLGDLARAEDYYSRELAIREKLRPGSADEADCLHMLGMVIECARDAWQGRRLSPTPKGGLACGESSWDCAWRLVKKTAAIISGPANEPLLIGEALSELITSGFGMCQGSIRRSLH